MHIVTELVRSLLCLVDLEDVLYVFLSPRGPLPDAILQSKRRHRCLEDDLLADLAVDRDPLGARLWHNLRPAEGFEAEAPLVVHE